MSNFCPDQGRTGACGPREAGQEGVRACMPQPENPRPPARRAYASERERRAGQKGPLVFLNHATFVILAALTTINGHVIFDVAIFFPEFIRSHIAYQATSAFRAFRFDLVSFLCHVLPPSRCFFLYMEIFDFHSLFIKNSWDLQFVKHRFDSTHPPSMHYTHEKTIDNTADGRLGHARRVAIFGQPAFLTSLIGTGTRHFSPKT
jgi:hypothetical protein